MATPFDDRKLIATRNVLWCNRTNHTAVRTNNNPNVVNWGAATKFGISILFQINSLVSFAELATQRTGGAGDGFALRLTSDGFVLRCGLFFFPSGSGTTIPDIIKLGELYRLTICFEPYDGSVHTIKYKINGRSVVTATNALNPAFTPGSDIYLGGSYLYTGLPLTVDGFIGDVLFFNDTLTEREFNTLHGTNAIESSAHSKIIAHYPLNQIAGATAYDVVEQYNYAKGSPLTATHGTLLNYTTDELGNTNVLTQSAWQNIYLKEKLGTSFLSLIDTTTYPPTKWAKSNYTMAASSWSLFLDCVIPLAGIQSAIFINQESAASWPTGLPNIVMAIYDGGTIQVASGMVGGVVSGGTFFATPGSRVKLLFICNGTDTKVYNSAGPSIMTLGAPTSFETFYFGRDTQAARFPSVHFAKAIAYTKVLTQREINLVYNSDQSQEYRNISNCFLDIDFGNVFQSGADLFCRDRSGNSRHAQLAAYTLAGDTPLRVEQKTSLPERIKALRFVKASNHYLNVSGFNPTSEKGYTIAVGFCIVGTGDDNHCFIGKNSDKLILTTFPVANELWYYSGDASFGISLTKIPYNKPMFVVIQQKQDGSFLRRVFTINGTRYIDSATMGTITGYDSISGDLIIGAQLSGVRNANAYIFHASIFKSFFNHSQLNDLTCHALYGNSKPADMADCQLYLNFEKILVNGTTYTIKDWSPQNRTVTLNNYTANEVNPAHADYKLFNLDSLR